MFGDKKDIEKKIKSRNIIAYRKISAKSSKARTRRASAWNENLKVRVRREYRI